MNPLRGSCVSERPRCGAVLADEPSAAIVSGRSRCGAVRISKLADEPSAGIVRVADEPSDNIVRVGALSLWRRANLHARRRTLNPAGIVRVGAPSLRRRANFRGSCVSERSRCGAVRSSKLADEPSAGIMRVADEPSVGIVRVGALSLWRRANLHTRRRTLCGDCACRRRSRCGAAKTFHLADEPSAGIVRVGAPSLWRRANFLRRRRTLCADRACSIALAVALCKFACWPTNPLRGSCVSDRSRCGDVRICTLADEPSARIVRVGSLSPWFSLKLSRKVVCEARSRTSGLRMASCK